MELAFSSRDPLHCTASRCVHALGTLSPRPGSVDLAYLNRVRSRLTAYGMCTKSTAFCGPDALKLRGLSSYWRGRRLGFGLGFHYRWRLGDLRGALALPLGMRLQFARGWALSD